MNLAEAKCLEIPERAQSALQAAIEAWTYQPASEICDHGQQCCAVAREWFFAMDRSHTPASEPLTGPRWIRQRVAWGPSHWPLFWCQAMATKTLDCGALAALAKNAFRARGLQSHTVQLIQQFTTSDGGHWACSWERAEVAPTWIRDDLVYHEACAVVAADHEIRIWDPTASWWMNPKHTSGYSGLLALRVLVESNADTPLSWGAHKIFPDVWQPLQYRDTPHLAAVAA
jgi:hypothetical protein